MKWSLETTQGWSAVHHLPKDCVRIGGGRFGAIIGQSLVTLATDGPSMSRGKKQIVGEVSCSAQRPQKWTQQDKTAGFFPDSREGKGEESSAVSSWACAVLPKIY